MIKVLTSENTATLNWTIKVAMSQQIPLPSFVSVQDKETKQ